MATAQGRTQLTHTAGATLELGGEDHGARSSVPRVEEEGSSGLPLAPLVAGGVLVALAAAAVVLHHKRKSAAAASMPVVAASSTKHGDSYMMDNPMRKSADSDVLGQHTTNPLGDLTVSQMGTGLQNAHL